MKFALISGLTWGLDTVILGIACAMAPYIGTAEAVAFAAVASAFVHDLFCAVWLWIYMGVKRRWSDTLKALKTRSGRVVILGALLVILAVVLAIEGIQTLMKQSKAKAA